jgi:transposase
MIIHKNAKITPVQRKFIFSLFYDKGYRVTDLAKRFHVSRPTIYKILKQGRQGDFSLHRSANHSVQINPKHKHPDNIDAVFKVLHAPPSLYGFNRTTWRLKDLHDTLINKGYPISIDCIRKIIKSAGYSYRKAKKVLTSNDPEYEKKMKEINRVLSSLKDDEKFFSVDEFGPVSVKMQGGRALTSPGTRRTIPQWQKSKGKIIITAALELSKNQITHFYSEKKNTIEMIKLLEVILEEYKHQKCIYFSWDAATWHASKMLYQKVASINAFSRIGKLPEVKLVPLPSSAQFLNVIESVFSGLARAVIHNSNYQSIEELKDAIDRYFLERNLRYEENPKRAGNVIWGSERVKPIFKESNNCKDTRYR